MGGSHPTPRSDPSSTALPTVPKSEHRHGKHRIVRTAPPSRQHSRNSWIGKPRTGEETSPPHLPLQGGPPRLLPCLPFSLQPSSPTAAETLLSRSDAVRKPPERCSHGEGTLSEENLPRRLSSLIAITSPAAREVLSCTERVERRGQAKEAAEKMVLRSSTSASLVSIVTEEGMRKKRQDRCTSCHRVYFTTAAHVAEKTQGEEIRQQAKGGRQPQEEKIHKKRAEGTPQGSRRWEVLDRMDSVHPPLRWKEERSRSDMLCRSENSRRPQDTAFWVGACVHAIPYSREKRERDERSRRRMDASCLQQRGPIPQECPPPVSLVVKKEKGIEETMEMLEGTHISRTLKDWKRGQGEQ